MNAMIIIIIYLCFGSSWSAVAAMRCADRNNSAAVRPAALVEFYASQPTYYSSAALLIFVLAFKEYIYLCRAEEEEV